jgi:hypothetical protein
VNRYEYGKKRSWPASRNLTDISFILFHFSFPHISRQYPFVGGNDFISPGEKDVVQLGINLMKFQFCPYRKLRSLDSEHYVPPCSIHYLDNKLAA